MGIKFDLEFVNRFYEAINARGLNDNFILEMRNGTVYLNELKRIQMDRESCYVTKQFTARYSVTDATELRGIKYEHCTHSNTHYSLTHKYSFEPLRIIARISEHIKWCSSCSAHIHSTKSSHHHMKLPHRGLLYDKIFFYFVVVVRWWTQ